MEEKKEIEKKNKMKVIIPLILIGVVFVLGATYAWLTQRLNGEQVQRIKAATNLELELDDLTSQGINLENAIPMADSQGLGLTPYTFTVTNKGAVDISYKLYLDDVEIAGTRLPDNLIKYAITKNGSEPDPKLLSTTHQTENSETVRVLDNTTISAKSGNTNTVNTYTLKLWIDSTATTDIANKIFKGKIRLEAVQSH